jgi:hypothetical protein
MDEASATDPRTRLRRITPARYRWSRHVALVAAFTATGVAISLTRLGRLGVADGLALGGMLVAIVLLFGTIWRPMRRASAVSCTRRSRSDRPTG